MLTDANFSFGLPAISNSNTATVSSNVIDYGAATKLFAAAPNRAAKLWFRAPVSVDTTAVRIDVVGSDAAAMNSNNVVLASKYITHDALGAALGTGTQNIEGEIVIHGQEVAKRYYGLLVTLVGTNPDMTAGDAEVVLDGASNMRGARAAVPS